MLTTEKAFDMLPNVVDLYDKLDLDGYRKKVAEENKGKSLDQMSAGINLFKFVLKNSGKVKNEVFEIVAVFEDKAVEEIKAQNFITTMNSFKEIFSDKEAVGFFKDAIR
ncbi:hypothetical protein [Desulfosporosinus meridiei]|uniref:Uncharacterized protein n=1 Tax=Desulfosporosinus meridiei (strain ATCC BAA-275 / DSM 13257 / KCTC 12902 / NCIMB 13706 / S10) TaxID=768704 RepID=J7IWQ5_DESMD|nr:hypothetical protein [Desulfosporosinus meridiei]AFQ46262.1 hypothetical protein Desmer_4456 [Desulfosporosinus meridiei DSM 13257]